MVLIQRSHLEKFKFRTPPTRYSVLFQRFYWDNIGGLNIVEEQITDHANYQGELNLIKEVYDGVGPEIVKVKSRRKKTEGDLVEVEIEYGFLVLDYQTSSVLKSYNFPGMTDKKDKLVMKDIFFRGKDEVPDGYEWDGKEEYEGWLRFRWGDKQNALNLKPTTKPQSLTPFPEPMTLEEEIEEKYDNLREKEILELKKERW